MKNVQISFDENLIDAVDRMAASSKTSRSAVIRDAIRHWLREKEIKEFEENWIQSLKEKPDDSKDTEAWTKAQQWSDQE